MRRSYLFGITVFAVAVTVFLACRPTSAPAESAEAVTVATTAEVGKSQTEALLPITRVVLFSSGVGYFQREGTIEGNQRIDLTFDIRDINDLLKSMTLQDLGDGHISAVTYDSNAPIDRTLKSFAVNLTTNPGYGQILNQARGEKVEVVLQPNNATQPQTMTGTVIGIETKAAATKDAPTATAEHLNLWCADGMRAVKLSEVQRVRFLNPIMEVEFKKALETLALSHDTQKKAVSIQCDGQGKRNIRVSYVTENPLWKTSYRLVLPRQVKEQPVKEEEKKEVKKESPTLQGWAMVENVTDDDWSNVKMALVSGRPISFNMNLYDPLFISRPTVEPELFASLRPVTYSGGGFGLSSADPGAIPVPTNSPLRDRDGEKEEGAQLRKRQSGEAKDAKGGAWGKELDEKLDLGKGVASSASASKLGDYFQYAIDHAVTLPRQKSAMLPIVQKDVTADRVSIYNERVHNKFPLLGLVFKNNTGMNLMQGPITVYEGSNYAGDARILDLQKDEQRLLSYAIDLGTEVQSVPHTDNGKLTSVKIIKGIIHTKTKVKDSRKYTIVNRNDLDRVVLIEHPNRSEFTLTSKDKPWETAQDVYRFRIEAPAGKTTVYDVSEERDFGTTVAFSNSDDQSIRVVLNDVVTSKAVQEALKSAIAQKQKLGDLQRDFSKVQEDLKQITDDQDRLRKNIREVPQDSEAYKKYVKKFDAQEVEIEKLQAKLTELREEQVKQKKAYDDFLINLNAE